MDNNSEQQEIVENAIAMISGGTSTELLTGILSYREMMLLYECAIKEIKTNPEIIDTEYGAKFKRKPIHTIQTRLH